MMKVSKFIQLQHILITVREHSQRRLVCIPSQMVFLILIHLRMMMLRRTGRRRGCWLMECSRMLMSWRVSAETIFWCQSRLLATLLCSPVMGNIYWNLNWLLLTSSDLEMVSLKDEPHSEKVLYCKTSSFLDC